MRTQAQLKNELRQIHWLSHHPAVPQHVRQILQVAGAALAWAYNNRRPVSEIFTKALIEDLNLSGIHHCHICGCTEDYACSGRCGWSADPTVCTKCASL